MKLRTLVVVAVALAAAGGVVAWTLSLRAPMVSAEFAGQADQLCADYHQAVGEIGGAGSLASVPALVARQKPLAVALRRALEQLDPPASKARDYARFLALVRGQIALLDAQRAAAVAQQPAAFHRAVAAARRGHAAEGRVATRLGFFVCGH